MDTTISNISHQELIKSVTNRILEGIQLYYDNGSYYLPEGEDGILFKVKDEEYYLVLSQCVVFEKNHGLQLQCDEMYILGEDDRFYFSVQEQCIIQDLITYSAIL